MRPPTTPLDKGRGESGISQAPSATHLVMNSTLGRIVGSVAVSVAVLGMVVSAAPKSAIKYVSYPVFAPTLQILNVDTSWGYFSPNPTRGFVVRYDVIDASGGRHSFRLTESLSRWGDIGYTRVTGYYTELGESRPRYAQGAARHLCNRHHDLDPRQIELMVGTQPKVNPVEFLRGKDLYEFKFERWDPIACETSSPRS